MRVYHGVVDVVWLISVTVLVIVLAWAAIAKLRSPDSLTEAAEQLRLPRVIVRCVRILPAVELLLAVALVVVWFPNVLVGVTGCVLALMLAYTAVIARGLTLRPRPRCACFGTLGGAITPLTLIRNLALSAFAGVSLAGAIMGLTMPFLLFSPLNWMIVGAVVVIAIVVALGARKRTGVKRSSTAAHGSNAIPALANGRDRLLVWVTCACGEATAAANRLDEWQGQLSQLDARLVSTLTAAETAATFPQVTDALPDPQGRAHAALGLDGATSAVVIDATGRVIAGRANGLAGIISLVDELSHAHAEDSLGLSRAHPHYDQSCDRSLNEAEQSTAEPHPPAREASNREGEQ